MEAKIKVIKFNQQSVLKYIDSAKTAGSDNGLSGNYITVVLPVIEERTINNTTNSFGAFHSLLFDDNGDFVKKGAISLNTLQRTLRLAEEWDELPEGITMTEINKLPTIDLIAGYNRQLGKSLFEILQDLHKNNKVIVLKEKRKVINQNFKEGKPCVEGTTVRERNIFQTVENEEIFAKIPKIMGEIYDSESDAEIKKYFDAAGIDCKIER